MKIRRGIGENEEEEEEQEREVIIMTRRRQWIKPPIKAAPSVSPWEGGRGGVRRIVEGKYLPKENRKEMKQKKER